MVKAVQPNSSVIGNPRSRRDGPAGGLYGASLPSDNLARKARIHRPAAQRVKTLSARRPREIRNPDYQKLIIYGVTREWAPVVSKLKIWLRRKGSWIPETRSI